MYNSKRSEVISRIQRGHLNFLPLRTVPYTIRCSLLWSSSARLYPFTKLILLGFLPNPVALTVWSVVPAPHLWYFMYVCLCAPGKMCKDGRIGVVTWLAPGSVVLCGRGQGMDHFLTTTWRKDNMVRTEKLENHILG